MLFWTGHKVSGQPQHHPLWGHLPALGLQSLGRQGLHSTEEQCPGAGPWEPQFLPVGRKGDHMDSRNLPCLPVLCRGSDLAPELGQRCCTGSMGGPCLARRQRHVHAACLMLCSTHIEETPVPSPIPRQHQNTDSSLRAIMLGVHQDMDSLQRAITLC